MMSSPSTTSGSCSKPKIYLAADGFGEDLKNSMKVHLETKYAGKYDIEDIGVDTYYDAAGKVGKSIGGSSDSDSSKGILVCGTGMGVGIMANKYPGVRAATCENITAVKYSRAVNDANVLCLGQLITPKDDAVKMLDAFLEQEFNTPPIMENGQPAKWWNDNVEQFLSTSKSGISRVEEEAIASNSAKIQQKKK